MKVQRNNVFETNSSSTHSITVPRKNVANNIPMTETSIVVETGEFGWEHAIYDTPQEVLSYLFTAICINYKQDWKKYTLIIDEILSRYKTGLKITWKEPKFDIEYDNDGNIKYCCLENDYIDHGYKLKKWLEDIFNDNDLLVQTILFGKIETDNDNCPYHIDYHDTDTCNNEREYYYFKGN